MSEGGLSTRFQCEVESDGGEGAADGAVRLRCVSPDHNRFRGAALCAAAA